ncbi:hypothetical protein J5X84_06715 [Streptosporangiaceae bacterium NEAU-GS5]|nr:hypothetical protein [Streptosporangiaceae bacterium NEAU-GS5]
MKSLVIAAVVLTGASASVYALSSPATAQTPATAHARCSKHRVATTTKGLAGRRVSLWQCGSTGGFHATISGGRPGDAVWVRNGTTSVRVTARVSPGHSSATTRPLTLGSGQTVWACGDPAGRTTSKCTVTIRYTQPGGPGPTIPG